MSAEPMSTCGVPGCDQPSVAMLANDLPLTAAQYAERNVCRWHMANPFAERVANDEAPDS